MSKRYVTPLHVVEYVAWVIAGTVLRVLPRRALVILADAVGWFGYRIIRLRKRVVEHNVKRALGDSLSARQLDQVILRSYQHAVLTLFEFLTPNPLWYKVEDIFLPAVRRELFEQVYPDTALIVTGHIGNWETMASYAPFLDIKVAAVAKPMHNELIDASIMKGRKMRNLLMISTDSPMKGIVRAAKDGWWVTFLTDQDARRTGTFVNFFNRPASTAEGAALFSWKLNLPMMPMFFVRQWTPLRHLQMHFLPAIYPDPKAPRDQEILRLTQAHTAALEQIVREFPENYFWMHRRWKTKPKRRERAQQPVASPKLKDTGQTQSTATGEPS